MLNSPQQSIESRDVMANNPKRVDNSPTCITATNSSNVYLPEFDEDGNSPTEADMANKANKANIHVASKESKEADKKYVSEIPVGEVVRKKRASRSKIPRRLWHQIARLEALGLTSAEIARRINRAPSQISNTKKDPDYQAILLNVNDRLTDYVYDVEGHARDYLSDAITLHTSTLENIDLPLATRIKSADKIMAICGIGSGPKIKIVNNQNQNSLTFEQQIEAEDHIVSMEEAADKKAIEATVIGNGSTNKDGSARRLPSIVKANKVIRENNPELFDTDGNYIATTSPIEANNPTKHYDPNNP